MDKSVTKITVRVRRMGQRLLMDADFYRDKHDVVCDVRGGIIPRGLIFESNGRRPAGRGSIIVGVNPGNAEKDEKEFYKNHKDYKDIAAYWEENILSKEYYRNLRSLVDQVGLVGPILWTELVKCESASVDGKKRELQVETIRADINEHLFQEIELTPGNWPLIGISKPAYAILSYRFPKRTVIGIPHATASFGYFDRLFNDGILKLEFKQMLMQALQSQKPAAVALFGIGKSNQ